MNNFLLIATLSLTISATFTSALLPDLPHFFFSNTSGFLPNKTSKAPWDEFKSFTGYHHGMKLEGLSKIKQYFQNFGYIDSLVFNFTDDFDDVLTSAVKTYQKNFNLNVTGELDDATLHMIAHPRCGNKDIINGTSTMHSGKKFSSARFHITGHYSFFPNTPRWPKSRYRLKYAFLAQNQLSRTVKNVFARAFMRWSQVIPLTFTETALYTTADIRIGFYVGNHGDGSAFDGALGVLAHAFAPTNGRCHFDGAETWVVAGDITRLNIPNAFDLETVAIHEIGHLLGLGHSSVPGAVMYPTVRSGTRKVNLARDDVNGVQFLYGSKP